MFGYSKIKGCGQRKLQINKGVESYKKGRKKVKKG
jgi:hypothetical protein